MTDDKKSSELIQTKFGSSDEPDSRKEKDFTLPLCKGHLFDNEQAHIWYMNHLNDILQMHIKTLLQKNFTIYQLDWMEFILLYYQGFLKNTNTFGDNGISSSESQILTNLLPRHEGRK